MKVTKVVVEVLMAVFFTASSTFAFAHEGHDHHADKGPHGGEIVMTGSYHYEMIVKLGEIDLYVLDAKMHPLPLKGMEGSLLIQLADHTIKETSLLPAGDYFKAAVDLDVEKNFVAAATLKIDGKETVGHFRHASKEQVQEDQNNQKYTCSMHPEVIQDKPGKCPKCGMDLVPEKPEEEKQKKTPDAQQQEHHH